MKKTFLLLAVVIFLAAVPPVKSKLLFTANSQSDTRALFESCSLNGLLSFDVFAKSLEGFKRYNPQKSVIAICDFTKPSSKERFFVIDLNSKKLLYHSLVAHGKNSGELMATSFSNQPGSLKSSLGFYKVGSPIQSPKHGLALTLYGLEKSTNDNALKREIIIHGAEYVSEQFVQQYGRLGRSFGCPAIPFSLMKDVADTLKNGALLYIYAG